MQHPYNFISITDQEEVIGQSLNDKYGVITNKLPENIYYASGFGGNYVVIVPNYDLVIVVRWLDSDKIGELIKKIINSHLKISVQAVRKISQFSWNGTLKFVHV